MVKEAGVVVVIDAREDRETPRLAVDAERQVPFMNLFLGDAEHVPDVWCLQEVLQSPLFHQSMQLLTRWGSKDGNAKTSRDQGGGRDWPFF